MNGLVKFSALLLTIPELLFSCNHIATFPITEKDGFKEYSNGKYELKMYVSTGKDNSTLSSVWATTNGKFVLMNKLKGAADNDSLFVVNPKEARIWIDDTQIKLTKCRMPSENEACFDLIKKKDMLIFFSSTTSGETVKILPSDFILNNGRRVINDTIQIRRTAIGMKP